MADNKKIAEFEAALSAANKRAEEAEKRANAAEEKLDEVEKKAKYLETTLQDELNLRDVEEEETIARVHSLAADELASHDVEQTELDKERMELQILLKNKMVLLDDAEKRATTAEKRVEVLEKELAQLNHGSASSTDRDFLDAVRDTFARTPGLQEELQNVVASSRALMKEILTSSPPDTENRMKAMSKEPLAHKEALCEELGLRDVDRSERMMRTLDAAAADEEVEEKDNYIAQLQTQVSKEKKAEAAE